MAVKFCWCVFWLSCCSEPSLAFHYRFMSAPYGPGRGGNYTWAQPTREPEGCGSLCLLGGRSERGKLGPHCYVMLL